MSSLLTNFSPEKRIEQNPYDVDAWNLLLREKQKRPIAEVQEFYERLLEQFPNAGRFWKTYIEHELREKNLENVEKLFSRCLIKVLNIDLWKCYLYYVKETKGSLPSFREKMAQAYDFALEKIGFDMHSYHLYEEYVNFLKTVPAVGQYAENQKIAAVRKVYQRAVLTPVLNVEQIWAEYCGFEKSVNPTLAEKLISEKSKDHQHVRKVAKELEVVTRGLNRQMVSVPPKGTAPELKQLELWKKFIRWEKGNPLSTSDYTLFVKRVVYAYEQALLCLGHHSDLWYDAALFIHEASRTLAEKGEPKFSLQLLEDVGGLFERAITTLLRDSQLLYFAYADFEEERMKYAKVESIYQRLINVDHVDPTLAYIQLMKFKRRSEGIAAARVVFKKAREDDRCRYQVYVAAALMEYYCSKDEKVAMRIFELGLKKFGHEPEFALAFIDYLSHLNEDNNTRVLFERILTSGSLPAEKSLEVWDRYLEFESQVGDLVSILKVDKRRREALQREYSDLQALLLIDRYKFLDLLPCTSEQLKVLGYKSTNVGKSHGASVSLGPSGDHRSVGGPSSSQHGPSSSGGTSHHRNGGGTLGHAISAYPLPDLRQLIPFKPKIISTSSYHPVPGGVFPPPPAVSSLMKLLPPPYCFNGPFVRIDQLMDTLRQFVDVDDDVEFLGSSEIDQKPFANGTFGGRKVEDIKKEFYQLLATTPDPNQVISRTSKRKAPTGTNDSDDGSSESGSLVRSTKDVYMNRMRQNTKKAK